MDLKSNNSSKSFFADDATTLLADMERTFREHLLPFMGDWWSGSEPIPTAEQVQGIQTRIRSRVKERGLPEGFEMFAETLIRLACSMRFNRRNYVNIHPNPFVPAVLAALAVSLQNPNNIVEEVSRATSEMEKEAVFWLAEHLFGFDPKLALVNLVSGGTVPNMSALIDTRDYTYDKLSHPRPS